MRDIHAVIFTICFFFEIARLKTQNRTLKSDVEMQLKIHHSWRCDY
jgi:hypothetical protein